MSIEKELERIAVGIETLAAILVNAEPNKPVKPAKPAEDVIPGEQGLPGFEENSTVPVVLATVGVKTLEDLRTFVQKYLTAAEKLKKTEAVVTFVKNTLCPKFAPKEPKLMKIPVDKVSEAAQMMYDWGLKNKIIIE